MVLRQDLEFLKQFKYLKVVSSGYLVLGICVLDWALGTI